MSTSPIKDGDSADQSHTTNVRRTKERRRRSKRQKLAPICSKRSTIQSTQSPGRQPIATKFNASRGLSAETSISQSTVRGSVSSAPVNGVEESCVTPQSTIRRDTGYIEAEQEKISSGGVNPAMGLSDGSKPRLCIEIPTEVAGRFTPNETKEDMGDSGSSVDHSPVSSRTDISKYTALTTPDDEFPPFIGAEVSAKDRQAKAWSGFEYNLFGGSETSDWKLVCNKATQARIDALKPLDKHPKLEGRVYLLLDGDGCIFHSRFLQRGAKGAEEAFRILREELTIELQCRPLDDSQIVLWVYYNQKGLVRVLKGQPECSRVTLTQFTDFMTQISSINALNACRDTGPTKGSADDALIGDLNRLFEDSDSIDNKKTVYLGVCHDGGYAPHISKLLDQEHGPEIRLIQYSGRISTVYQDGDRLRLSHPIISISSLFRLRRLEVQNEANASTSCTPTNSGARKARLNIVPISSSRNGYALLQERQC